MNFTRQHTDFIYQTLLTYFKDLDPLTISKITAYTFTDLTARFRDGQLHNLYSYVEQQRFKFIVRQNIYTFVLFKLDKDAVAKAAQDIFEYYQYLLARN